jgi:hypothetical protein
MRRQLELAGGEDELLGAVGRLERVVRQREARVRHSYLAPADGELGVGVQGDVVTSCRQGQARRAPARRVARITALLDGADDDAAAAFDQFLQGLRDNLNDSITAADAVSMLAQHLITKPVFDALFAGHEFALSMTGCGCGRAAS